MPRGTDETRITDVNIGRVIQSKRIELGITIIKLADALGVTHQQVQKYARGTNRLPASYLPILAKELNIKISDFFEEQKVVITEEWRLRQNVGRNFVKIPSKKQRYEISRLIEVLATG